MVSAFGSSDAPTTRGYNPTTLAQQLASFVIEWDFDGVDVDYEDFTAMDP
jgi:GH18 family chitinase